MAGQLVGGSQIYFECVTFLPVGILGAITAVHVYYVKDVYKRQTTWSAITGGVTSGIYNSITYAIDKNGEDPVGSESDGKFTVDMDHAKDNMALTVNVNCRPNDAAEPASIANQKVKFISLSKLLTSTFGATDAKKGITTAYTAETIDAEIDVLGDRCV